MRTVWIVIGSAALTVTAAFAIDRCSRRSESVGVTVYPPFRVPSTEERHRALGPLDPGMPFLLRGALTRDEAFAPIVAPAPEDWLAAQHEPGQTFVEFVGSNPNRPDSTRRIVYLQPLGSFAVPDAPSLEVLQRFAEAFFGLPVRIQAPEDLAHRSLTQRQGPSGANQFLTSDILKILSSDLPKDAFCRLGLTMEDLYPGPTWNFVFGQATLSKRVGIYSFARYTQRPAVSSPGASAGSPLLRSCKVLAHETGHMFGLLHCIYYSCLMNGSNHLGELDAQPLHLCPVCLRKLQHSTGFDVVTRYQRLHDICREAGLDDEAAWLAVQLRALTAAEPTHPGGPS